MIVVNSVALRQPRSDDLAGFCKIRRDREMQDQLMAVVQDTDENAVADWIARKASSKDLTFLVVSDTASEQFLGYVQISSIHRESSSGYVGIAILKEKRALGIGYKALAALHSYAKLKLRLFKLILLVRADNLPANKLYTNIGYRRVGFLEKHYPRDNSRVDVFVYECIL